MNSISRKESSCAFNMRFSLPDNPAAGQHPAMHLSVPERHRVLLVDDSRENRELMKLLLAKQPLVIDEACNGQEAMELFEHADYSLVLMDIQMPLLDGYGATRMIRSIEELRGLERTPVVALTAHSFEADILQCKESGCDEHLAKPFKKTSLLRCLAAYLDGINDEPAH